MSKYPAPQDTQWPEGTIFTVGHSTLPIEQFLAVLKAYRIERLVDIRTLPRSRRNPQFERTALADSLSSECVDYVHLPALGGLRHPRKESPNTGWRNQGFRGYADYMQTQAFAAALDRAIQLAQGTSPTVLMCGEAVPWRCHRSLVADALIVRGIRVLEIISAAEPKEHALTPFAHVRGTRITYPADQRSLLETSSDNR